jgi:hypothetical protein
MLKIEFVKHAAMVEILYFGDVVLAEIEISQSAELLETEDFADVLAREVETFDGG